MSAPAAPVVVGVSPSSGSPSALRWSYEEAQLRGAPLRAVSAWRPPRPPASPAMRPPATGVVLVEDDPEVDADQALEQHVTAALGPEAQVERVVVRGSAVNALLTASTDAQLLVVGEPRSGRLASVRTGFVAPQVILRASCPVVVMPSPNDDGGQA